MAELVAKACPNPECRCFGIKYQCFTFCTECGAKMLEVTTCCNEAAGSTLDRHKFCPYCGQKNAGVRFKPTAVVLIIVGLFLFAAPAFAEIGTDRAIHAILGEARGEGYKGMYAVACAIRNRGTLKGVYGLRADVSDASAQTYQLAAKAWAESEDGPDVTNGANSWENVDAFGTPYWAKGKRPTAIVGRHRFFNVK